MATMKDIANLVGVSLTTVSNVVHGNYDRVSPQTVQRILDAIEQLHYVPNMSARVPEDISIVGFDDVDIARMTFPPLTTIHQDGIGKGRRAAEAIFAMIDGEHPDPKDFNLPVKLIVRGSTGPARTN